jgi:phage shock protein PspC (stress-responsive transcriptional regulator)
MNTSTAGTGWAATTEEPAARQLRRSTSDKMVAGVAGGIARYLHADVTVVRIIIAVLALCTGVGALLYLAAWLLIPEAGQAQPVVATWIAGRQDQSC